jgi:hypothetical protein
MNLSHHQSSRKTYRKHSHPLNKKKSAKPKVKTDLPWVFKEDMHATNLYSNICQHFFDKKM